MAEQKKSSIGGKKTCHLLNVKKPERTAKRLKVGFQRIHVVINIQSSKQVDASMTLIDISESGAGLFTEKLLGKGNSIELTVSEPRELKVRGVVAWSIPVASGIQSRKYPFRSGIQFQYASEKERVAVLEFVKFIEARLAESTNPGLEQPKAEPHFTSENPPLTPEAAAAPMATAAPEAAVAPAAEAPVPASATPTAETPAAGATPPAPAGDNPVAEVKAETPAGSTDENKAA